MSRATKGSSAVCGRLLRGQHLPAAAARKVLGCGFQPAKTDRERGRLVATTSSLPTIRSECAHTRAKARRSASCSPNLGCGLATVVELSGNECFCGSSNAGYAQILTTFHQSMHLDAFAARQMHEMLHRALHGNHADADSVCNPSPDDVTMPMRPPSAINRHNIRPAFATDALRGRPLLSCHFVESYLLIVRAGSAGSAGHNSIVGAPSTQYVPGWFAPHPKFTTLSSIIS